MCIYPLQPLTKVQRYTFICIMIAAIFTRIIGLDYQSFWFDELFTRWSCSFENYKDFLKYAIYPDVHPPLYNLCLFFYAKIFGFSEISLRIPSAIVGVLSVWWIFKLGSIIYDKKVGLLSSVFMLIMWFPYYVSQEVRSYSFVILFVTIYLYYLIKIIMNLKLNIKVSKLDILFYIISGIILTYLHYYTLFFVVFSALLLKCTSWKKTFKAMIPCLIILLFFLPWIPIMINHLHHGKLWMEKFSLLAYFSSVDFITFNYKPFSVFMFFILALFIFKKIYSIFREDKLTIENKLLCPDNDLLLIVTIIVPFLIFFIMAQVSTPSFTFRHYSIVLPALLVLFSKSIFTISQKKLIVNSIIAFFIILSVISTFYINNYYGKNKTDYRALTQYIIKQDSYNRNSIIVQGFKCFKQSPDIISHYFLMNNQKREFLSFDGKPENIQNVIKNYKSVKDTVWYVIDKNFNYPDLDSAVSKSFQIIDKQYFYRLILWKMKIVRN